MGLAFFIITKNRQLQHAQHDKDTVRKGLNPLRVKIFITPVGKKNPTYRSAAWEQGDLEK